MVRDVNDDGKRASAPLFLYAETLLPTQHGQFRCAIFRDHAGDEHVAMIKGQVKKASNVLCRIHSECLTGEVLGSLKCDCKQQLDSALQLINNAAQGVLIYLRQEGRGIGLGNKIRAYSLQEQGVDTVDANLMLGFAEDAREYHLAAEMLRLLEIESITLMTNNPHKIQAIRAAGIDVKHQAQKIELISKEAIAYLNVKRERMGHLAT